MTGRNSRRVSITVLFTLLLVLGEFAFLTGVYFRAQPVRQQRALTASYAGELDLATAGAQATKVAAEGPAFIAAMRHASASTAELRPVEQAVTGLAAQPDSPVALAALHDATQRLQAHVAAEQRSLDRQAEFIYAGLLVFVSIGWMLWFRKLVARHRRLQSQLTEAQTRQAGERRLGSLVRNSADVIAVCDADSTISFVTAACAPVLGLDADELVGRQLLTLVHPEDLDLFLHQLNGQRADDQSLTLRLRHADGRYLRISGTLANRLADPDLGGIVVTVRDITAQYELEQQLTHQAFHDSLTALANRQLFTDRLDHALIRRSNAQPMVVAFCDLDDFKNVNDTLGHGAGDRVLVEVAQRLVGTVRAGDTVARLGGDEFAILMESTDLDEAGEIAARLLQVLGQPIELDGQPLSTRASIGLAEARPGEMTGEEMLRNADVAMYLAKDNGKSSVAVYDETLHSAAVARMSLRSELQQAIREEQFVVYYQATVDLTSHDIIGFEALVRWNHPERGFVPPGEFIPAAEESGLIVPLGSWILAEACRAATTMTGSPTPYMSVNVAAKQLAREDFVAEVIDVLARTGLAAQRLVLEITESDVLGDLEHISPKLNELRSHGVRIAIDDFGTGYSSLAYLSHLPVDVLKVDKSFVDRVTVNEQDANLARAIITMSQTMNFKTVAEGVEHADQASWLAEAECSFGQGYLWSRPLPLDQAQALLAGDAGEAAA